MQNGSFGTRSIIEDKDGRFWFCNTLHRYEVDLSNSAEPKFNAVDGIRDAKDPKRVPFGGIMSSAVDSAGALWMATYGEGVWRYDGKNITHYPLKDGDKAITLISIHKDNQGVMWLGTHSAGAYRFNGKAFEKFKPLSVSRSARLPVCSLVSPSRPEPSNWPTFAIDKRCEIWYTICY